MYKVLNKLFVMVLLSCSLLHTAESTIQSNDLQVDRLKKRNAEYQQKFAALQKLFQDSKIEQQKMQTVHQQIVVERDQLQMYVNFLKEELTACENELTLSQRKSIVDEDQLPFSQDIKIVYADRLTILQNEIHGLKTIIQKINDKNTQYASILIVSSALACTLFFLNKMKH